MPGGHKKTAVPIPSASELEERASGGESFKNAGNDFFRQGQYKEAAAMYNAAVELNGTQPTYMANLAQCYLKLEDYELAEKAATTALIHDPRMIKARFRRGMARKATQQLRAAATDFVTILKEDPNCAEAKSELALVHQRIDNGEGDKSLIWEGDWDYPTPDARPRAPLPVYLLKESISEDRAASPDPEIEEDDLTEHVGNGIPCKHHNLKPLGCAKGASCAYSHAPDARSIPDTEGRNVCLYFLMGSCKFGERCLYSHSKANLPDLWGDETRIPDVRNLILQNELEIRDRRYFTKYMGKGPLAPEPLLAMKRAVDAAKAEKANRAYAAGLADMFDLLDVSLPEPFIMHLTLNKTTDIPRKTMSGLREATEVRRAKSKTKARSMLSSPDLVGVFITDAGITEAKNANLLTKIAEYVRGGGTVVIGGSFKLLEGYTKRDLTPAELEAFFQKGWGLSWKKGCSQSPTERKTSFARNHHTALQAPVPLPEAVSMTAALHLKGVRADAALYLSAGHPQLDSAKFRAAELVETPVVITEFGKGRLCFVGGDSGSEKAITEVIITMFGLSALHTAKTS